MLLLDNASKFVQLKLFGNLVVNCKFFFLDSFSGHYGQLKVSRGLSSGIRNSVSNVRWYNNYILNRNYINLSQTNTRLKILMSDLWVFISSCIPWDVWYAIQWAYLN